MPQRQQICPVCSARTLSFTVRKGPKISAFCTTCHKAGEPANTFIGAEYNYKDKPRTALPSVYKWKL